MTIGTRSFSQIYNQGCGSRNGGSD